MEGLNQEVKKNTYISKIEEIKNHYEGTSVFPIGNIDQVSYADLGKTLSLSLSGDVPTNFLGVNIIIVHPDSENDGWIGKGKIGFTLGGKGVDISKIPLPEATIKTIKDIYQEYTGKENREYFYRENDTNKFAVMGTFNEIVERADR